METYDILPRVIHRSMRGRLLPLRLCEDTRSDEETDGKSLRPHTDLDDLLRGGLVPIHTTNKYQYAIHHTAHKNISMRRERKRTCHAR